MKEEEDIFVVKLPQRGRERFVKQRLIKINDNLIFLFSILCCSVKSYIRRREKNENFFLFSLQSTTMNSQTITENNMNANRTCIKRERERDTKLVAAVVVLFALSLKIYIKFKSISFFN